MDDRTLIDECLRGRQSAYGELMRRYQDRLYNTVFRLVDNAEDAQDVVQEAFINAFQSLESFKGDALFFTWLYRIAINSAITLKRRRRAIVSIYAKTAPGRADSDPDMEPLDESEGNQPGDAMERREEEARLQAALNRLSPEYKTVLVLKDIEGQKYEDIAEVLGVPVGTVRSRLHRARLELRDLLAGPDDPE